MPHLSIIIPTYNGRMHLERCLPSVCRFAPVGSQILVVDDASTDQTVSWIRAHFPRVEVAALARNQGFVGAVNEGIRRSNGDIIELLNNDTEVCPGWVELALKWFADPTVGSVAPLVLQMDRPEFIDSAGMEYHICGWAFNRGFNRPLDAAYETPCEVFGPSGSSGFYRRAALEKTGLLLPELGAYFEDTDLAFRLRWAGYRCMFEPGSRVLHVGSASYKQESERVTRMISRNEELIFWMNLPEKQLLLGLLPHLGFLGVRLIRKLLDGRWKPFLQGKLQALQLWRTIQQRRRERQGMTRDFSRQPDLGVAQGTEILGRGIQWLKQRQCA